MKKTRLSITAAAVLITAVAYFLGGAELLLPVLAAIFIHELGHLVAIKVCGGGVDFVKICATGVVMGGTHAGSYEREIIIAAAGPAASLLPALIAAGLARRYGLEPLYRIAGLNLVFCVFNLLPIMPMDGGRIVKSFSARLWGLENAEKIVFVTGCFTLFLLSCAGVYIFIITGSNISLIICTLWLFCGHLSLRF